MSVGVLINRAVGEHGREFVPAGEELEGRLVENPEGIGHQEKSDTGYPCSQVKNESRDFPNLHLLP